MKYLLPFLLLFAACEPIQPGRPQSASSPIPAVTAESPHIELMAYKGRVEYDRLTIDGRIKNISNATLDEYMQVVVSVFDSKNNFIKSEYGYPEFKPLEPGQISPFKVEIDLPSNDRVRFTVEFKEFSGTQIKHIDRTK